MRLLFFLPLFFLISCASGPGRKIASVVPLKIGQVSAKSCSIKLFLNDSGHPEIHQFYLELKDAKNVPVDVELKDIIIKENQKILGTHVRRLSLGRYEVELEKDDSDLGRLKFLVQGKKVSHKFTNLLKPHAKHSKVVLVSDTDYRLKLRIYLRDHKKRAVESPLPPEVIMDGVEELSVPQMVTSGVWEVIVTYPDMNQILHLSVRANGVLLEKIFRFQHVEK